MDDICFLVPNISSRHSLVLTLVVCCSVKSAFFFPTCQVRVVRFYVRLLPSSFLPPSSFLTPSSAPRRTSTASSGSECSPPDLNHKESLKIYQIACQKRMSDRMPDSIPERMREHMAEKMPDRIRMPEKSQYRCYKGCQIGCQNRCQVECQKRMSDRMQE